MIKSTFILSQINEKELLRTLALNGIPTLNLHVVSAEKLAEEALLRNGIVMKGEKISSFRQQCILYNLREGTDYFKSSSFTDCGAVLESLNAARLMCRGNEDTELVNALSKGIFKEKNDALCRLFADYKQYLKDNNLYDSIDIINEAINRCCRIEGIFLSFTEEKLSPLWDELLETVSDDNYGKISQLSIYEDDRPVQKNTYDSAYGSVNEIEHIFATIAKESIPYDNCQVVMCDPSYAGEIIRFARLHKVPVTFSEGYPLSLSNAAHVYRMLIKWDNGYHGLNPLLELFSSSEFNAGRFWATIAPQGLDDRQKSDVLKAAGNLKLSTVNDSKMLDDFSSVLDDGNFWISDVINKMAQEFAKGYSRIIEKYTVIRESQAHLDEIGINTICQYIDEYLANIKTGKPEDIADGLLEKKICPEAGKPGALAVTGLKTALAMQRKHMFICGLNASSFPGSPREDCFLLDDDLMGFNEENRPLADILVQDKHDTLSLIYGIAKRQGSHVHLSYSAYNLTELKEENPSSVMFEIFRDERGSKASIDDLNSETSPMHRYFEEDISANKDLGEKYIEGLTLNIKRLDSEEFTGLDTVRRISPSSAEDFFTCPRKFYLKHVVGIKEPDEDDPFVILPGNTAGDMIHKCMEDYGSHPDWTEDEFMNNAERIFDDFTRQRIPLQNKTLHSVRQEFLDMARNGYKRDPHNEVCASEIWLSSKKHPSGLEFGGRADRIEKDKNGEYIIVDYKTYKEVKNTENDIDSCFQVVLYSWLLEETEGVKVNRGEYRYLRNVRTVPCVYNEGIRQQLDRKIYKLKDAIERGVYPYPEEEDRQKACRYCKFAGICGKNSLSDKESSEEAKDE